MRVAFDSNVLIYLAGGKGLQDQAKVDQARELYASLVEEHDLVAPAQALGEAFRVLTGIFRFPNHLVLQTLNRWEESFDIAPTTVTVMREAVRLAVNHQLQIWDAVILSAAFEANCMMVLSEDMQDGFVWQALTVVNPFAENPHPLLASLLDA